MKYCSAGLVAIILLCSLPSVSPAHKVNVFAYVDGDAIQVESYFTRSQKVRYGTLTITDLVTGGKILEGTTDEQGLFRFQPDAEFLETGHGMNILLNAGEGHQSNWQIAPEELAALTPSAPAAQSAVPAQSALASASIAPAAPAPPLTAEDLEALIGNVMDAKLAPIKQTLARQEADGPAVKDIIGGIGWILGLLGIAMYMKYRR